MLYQKDDEDATDNNNDVATANNDATSNTISCAKPTMKVPYYYNDSTGSNPQQHDDEDSIDTSMVMITYEALYFSIYLSPTENAESFVDGKEDSRSSHSKAEIRVVHMKKMNSGDTNSITNSDSVVTPPPPFAVLGIVLEPPSMEGTTTTTVTNEVRIQQQFFQRILNTWQETTNKMASFCQSTENMAPSQNQEQEMEEAGTNGEEDGTDKGGDENNKKDDSDLPIIIGGVIGRGDEKGYTTNGPIRHHHSRNLNRNLNLNLNTTIVTPYDLVPNNVNHQKNTNNHVSYYTYRNDGFTMTPPYDYCQAESTSWHIASEPFQVTHEQYLLLENNMQEYNTLIAATTDNNNDNDNDCSKYHFGTISTNPPATILFNTRNNNCTVTNNSTTHICPTTNDNTDEVSSRTAKNDNTNDNENNKKVDPSTLFIEGTDLEELLSREKDTDNDVTVTVTESSSDATTVATVVTIYVTTIILLVTTIILAKIV